MNYDYDYVARTSHTKEKLCPLNLRGLEFKFTLWYISWLLWWRTEDSVLSQPMVHLDQYTTGYLGKDVRKRKAWKILPQSIYGNCVKVKQLLFNYCIITQLTVLMMTYPNSLFHRKNNQWVPHIFKSESHTYLGRGR